MKSLLFICFVVLPFAAQADTLTLLSKPTPPPNSISVALSHCASIGFNTDYGTHTTVVIDGYPLYYVTAATDGRELVNSNAASYLWTP